MSSHDPAAEATIFRRQPLTRREMEQIPHTISPSGNFANTADGRTYLWSDRLQKWTPWN